MSKIQAVILAGGKGSRLRPYTTVLPKPLVPLDDYPIAEIIIRQFKAYGIKNIVISTGHLAELIEAYFGDGHRWGVHIQYVREDKPLGTAGAIKLVKNLADHFIMINGDTLTDLNYKNLLTFHKKSKSIATMTVKERVVKTDFGVIELGKKNILSKYIEKPEHKSFVSIGVNVLNKASLQYIKANESIGLPELMKKMKRGGETISCYKTKALWLDLGRPEDLQTAQDLWQNNKKKYLKDL